MLNDGVVKRERENGRMKWREASPRRESCGLRQVENSLRYRKVRVSDAHEEGRRSEKMLWDVGRWPREGP